MAIPVVNTKKKIASSYDLRTSRQYKMAVRKILIAEFEKLKRELISDFLSHPVTKEIEAGPMAKNISNTLGGVGNLFSYIGFESNEKPIKPIERMLREISMSAIITSRNGDSRAVVFYPTPKDIFDATPLPWANGRSWAKSIETGLSGFGYYLTNKEFDPTVSRSTYGIQTKSKIRSGRFKNVPYISSMIKQFELHILKLNVIV